MRVRDIVSSIQQGDRAMAQLKKYALTQEATGLDAVPVYKALGLLGKGIDDLLDLTVSMPKL